MNMNMKGIAAGVGLGVALGGSAALLTGSMSQRSRRSLRKTANKAMKSVESMVGDMRYLFK